MSPSWSIWGGKQGPQVRSAWPVFQRFHSNVKEEKREDGRVKQICCHKLWENENHPLPPSKEASQTLLLLARPEDVLESRSITPSPTAFTFPTYRDTVGALYWELEPLEFLANPAFQGDRLWTPTPRTPPA